MADAETGHEHYHHDEANAAAAQDHASPGHDGGVESVASIERVIDPVCGMKVDPSTSKHRFDHDGHTFHFCSARCREKFAASPDIYLKPAADPAPAPPKGTIYTCPMHPEIRQEGPGSCPLCGMALDRARARDDRG